MQNQDEEGFSWAFKMVALVFLSASGLIVIVAALQLIFFK